MSRSAIVVPVGMRKIYRGLERWRKSQTGRAPIPDALWKAAAEIALEHGVSRTAQILRLQYDKLKRMSGGRHSKDNALVHPPKFVELITPQQSLGADCVIEWESPRGRVIIRLKGTAMSDLSGLSRALWDSPR
jgi:hypothetical protein